MLAPGNNSGFTPLKVGDHGTTHRQLFTFLAIAVYSARVLPVRTSTTLRALRQTGNWTSDYREPTDQANLLV